MQLYKNKVQEKIEANITIIYGQRYFLKQKTILCEVTKTTKNDTTKTSKQATF